MSDTAKNILRSAEGLLGAATKAPLPPPWGIVVSALEAAAGLAADLMDRGLDPATAIQEVRSMLPDVEAAKGRVADLIRQKSNTPTG